MFAYLTSLYEPLLHDLFRAIMAIDPEGSRWQLMVVLGAGVFGAMLFEMWRDKEMQPPIAAWFVVLLSAAYAVACARQLFVFGFEGRHLINAMVLLWLVPGIALVLGCEVVRELRRLATRRAEVVHRDLSHRRFV